jgi:glycosyl transferase family 2
MSKTSSSQTPRLSVIVPLPDHRGHAIEAIRSWTQEQCIGHDTYEVIVTTDGREPSVESQISELMQSGDRLIKAENSSLHDCYNIGANAALGEILFFTESHVKAAPDCVEQMLRHFDNSKHDCVAVASGGIDEDRFAGQEQRIYEEALPTRISGGWNLCTVRGFAVKQVAFKQAGGFASRYGHFSELLLGAALAHTGARLGYAPLARVWHFNSGSVQHFGRELSDFGRDEIRFRAEHANSPLLNYLGPCPIWDQRHDLHRGTAGRRVLRALLDSAMRLLSGDLRKAGRCVEEACRFIPCVLMGPIWPRIKAAMETLLAIMSLRLCAPVDGLYYRAFRAMWNGQIRFGRASAIADLLAKDL